MPKDKSDNAEVDVSDITQKDPADLTGEDMLRLAGLAKDEDEDSETADDAEEGESEKDPEEESEDDKPEDGTDGEDKDELSEDFNIDEEDEEEPEKYALDESVLEGIPEEARERIKKRWAEQTKGLKKREAQFEQKSEELQVLASYDKAFSNKQTVGEAFKYLGNQLAAHHGLTLDQLVGLETKQAPPEDDSIEGLFKSAEDKAFERMKAEFGPELEAIRKDREAQKEQEALNAYVARAYKVVKKFAKNTDGVDLSESEFVTAIKHFPDLKQTPIKAYRKYWGDKIAAAKKVVAKKRAPELGADGSRQGQIRKDPSELTIEDFLKVK
jgi:hypothetical protein